MGRSSRRYLVAVLAAALSIVCSAHAAEAREPFTSSRRDVQQPTVEWRPGWDRFTPAEGAFTALLNLGTYVADKKLPDYRTPHLDFELPLVDPALRGLRARTSEHQAVWAQWSDIGFRSSVLFPYIVDAGIVALGIHHNVDVAAQLFLIDFEAFSFAGLAQHVLSRVTSRPRPYVQDCRDDGKSTSHICGDTRDNRSLYGGHSSAAFTAAGLTCLHHQHLPLWGGGAADTWACVWAISYATFTSMARIFADEHWASDTIAGIGTGWFFGYVLPQWLHYGSAGSKPRSLVGRLMIPGRTVEGDHPWLWFPTFSAVDDGGIGAIRAVF
jgi:hypothetical protein